MAAGGIGLFYAYDLTQYLSLENIKNQRQTYEAFYAAHPHLTLFVYFVFYVFVTGLSLPGAALLTLLGGTLFGLVIGTILVSFASTLGATIAFLMARFLLREWVLSRFQETLNRIDYGLQKEGDAYLFSLRLVPLIPFFLINLVVGLTNYPTYRFFLVSQIGMLPGTLVYVNAGTQLSQIEGLSGLFSLPLLVSFLFLAVFPHITRWGLNIHMRNQKLKKFTRPKQFKYNLVVVGGGSAGLVTSYIGAAAKAKVALIEKHKMGGDCLNTGCVPSKTLLRTAKFMYDLKRSKDLGIKSAHAEFDFSEVMERVRRVIKAIEPHDSVERYSQLGVDCIKGEARLLSPFEVQVKTDDGLKQLATRNIVIATGARPFVPPIPGLSQVEAKTSDTIWDLKELPKHLLVLGGGTIGCELAQAFCRLGSQVTIIERNSQILPREEDEVARLLYDQFIKEGIQLKTTYEASSFGVENGRRFCLIQSKSTNDQEKIFFDEVLVALGRRPSTESLGLKELGIELDNHGQIVVDDFLSATYPNIYACGDVVGPYNFTHTAAHQAWYCSVNAMARPFKSFRVNYDVIPFCTFTDPEIAHVGLTASQAREKNISYEVTFYDLNKQDRALAEESSRGFVKFLTSPGKDRILGATYVGLHAGECLSEVILAMKYGLGLNKILGTIHIYPTLTEANKAAAGLWRQKHVSPLLLRIAQRFHEWRLS